MFVAEGVLEGEPTGLRYAFQLALESSVVLCFADDVFRCYRARRASHSHLDVVFPPPSHPRPPAFVRHWAHAAIVDALVLELRTRRRAANAHTRLRAENRNRKTECHKTAGRKENAPPAAFSQVGRYDLVTIALGDRSWISAPSRATARVPARGKRVLARLSQRGAGWNSSALHRERVTDVRSVLLQGRGFYT
jgi:hypothetical protein